MYNHCLHGSRCQVVYAFVLTYFKQSVKTDTRYKNLTITLNKKHACKELFSFPVLTIPFIKENVEDSQTERVEKRYEQI